MIRLQQGTPVFAKELNNQRTKYSEDVMNTLNMQKDAAQATHEVNLHSCIHELIDNYFKSTNEPVGNLYELALGEFERPMLEAVLRHTRGNQSKAAIILGLSRGTLRKKLKSLGVLA